LDQTDHKGNARLAELLRVVVGEVHQPLRLRKLRHELQVKGVDAGEARHKHEELAVGLRRNICLVRGYHCNHERHLDDEDDDERGKQLRVLLLVDSELLNGRFHEAQVGESVDVLIKLDELLGAQILVQDSVISVKVLWLLLGDLLCQFFVIVLESFRVLPIECNENGLFVVFILKVTRGLALEFTDA